MDLFVKDKRSEIKGQDAESTRQGATETTRRAMMASILFRRLLTRCHVILFFLP